MMSRIFWGVTYEKTPSLYRWSVIEMTSGGNLCAHYVLATRPTRRQLRRLRNGRGDAVVAVHMF